MGINYPTVSQDVNFVGNSNNGFHSNQGFNTGWNKHSFLFYNRQQDGNGYNSIEMSPLSEISLGIR
jgi:hypothetical protein